MKHLMILANHKWYRFIVQGNRTLVLLTKKTPTITNIFSQSEED